MIGWRLAAALLVALPVFAAPARATTVAVRTDWTEGDDPFPYNDVSITAGWGERNRVRARLYRGRTAGCTMNCERWVPGRWPNSPADPIATTLHLGDDALTVLAAGSPELSLALPATPRP